MKRLALLLMYFAASSASAADPQAPDIGEQRAAFTMRMFLDLCMSTRGEPAPVRAQATRLGFRDLSSEAATRFTGPSGGRAWSVQITGGIWALALGADGVCSVYARQVDARALESLVPSWLPAPGSGFETQEKPATTSQNGLRTVSYQIRRGQLPFAVWVLSTSTSETAFYQGVISLRMAP